MSDQETAALSAHDHGNCELCDQIEAQLSAAQARIEELEQATKIEPLHGPDCPMKPYEDTVEDIPEDRLVCTCTSLAARWKARAMLARMDQRRAEAAAEAAKALTMLITQEEK